jgi:hypothetical protein
MINISLTSFSTASVANQLAVPAVMARDMDHTGMPIGVKVHVYAPAILEKFIPIHSIHT